MSSFQGVGIEGSTVYRVVLISGGWNRGANRPVISHFLYVSDETVAAEYAALIVQAKWRAFMLRKRTMMDIFYSSKGKVLKVRN